MSKNVKIQNFEGQSTIYRGVNYIKVLDADTAGQYDQFQLPPNLQSKAVSPSTSAQSITPDTGYDGLSSVNISAIETEQKTITQNGEFSPSAGKYFSKVTVNVPSQTPNLQEKTATSNGEVTPDEGYDGLSKVTVAVEALALDGDALPSDVKAGKTFYNTDSGTKVTGTMPEYNGELR